MRMILAGMASVAAVPAFAADGPFLSLGNTDFVVVLGFLLFVGVLLYFKVPEILGGLLDKRSDEIRSRLDEARALRDEAQKLLADFERKQQDVQEQTQLIVAQAKADAQEVAAQAHKDLEASIARRIQSAEEQIASAEAGAIRQVREQAISVAIAAARDVIAKGMTPGDADAMIEESIRTVDAKLH